eukprot:g12443.t1
MICSAIGLTASPEFVRDADDQPVGVVDNLCEVSRTINDCYRNNEWLATNGRRVISINPASSGISQRQISYSKYRLLDPHAYENGMWMNPPLLRKNESTFSLYVCGLTRVHLVFDFFTSSRLKYLMDKGDVVYDKDFRIALYAGNGKQFPAFDETATCDVSNVNSETTQKDGSGDQRVETIYDSAKLDKIWTKSISKSMLSRDFHYIDANDRSSCDWCLYGESMPPKCIVREDPMINSQKSFVEYFSYYNDRTNDMCDTFMRSLTHDNYASNPLSRCHEVCKDLPECGIDPIKPFGILDPVDGKRKCCDTSSMKVSNCERRKAETQYSHPRHRDLETDISLELRQERQLCLDYCAAARNEHMVTGQEDNWKQSGIGYGVNPGPQSSEGYVIGRYELPKSFRRVEAQSTTKVSITEQAKSSLKNGTVHLSFLALKNTTVFVEIEILDGSLHHSAFELFANVMKWSYSKSNRTGKKSDIRTYQNQRSAAKLMSPRSSMVVLSLQEMLKTEMDLPLNLHNHYLLRDKKDLVEGKLVYDVNNTELIPEKGEHEGVFGYHPVLGPYPENVLVASKQSSPRHFAPGFKGMNVTGLNFDLTEHDPVGTAPNVQDSIKRQFSEYWSTLDWFATPYLPYISNCKGYDSYIPLFELMEHPDCKRVGVESTEEMNLDSFLKPSEELSSDVCDLSLRCRYEDTYAANTKRLWFTMQRALGNFFYITRHPMSLAAFNRISWENVEKLQGATLHTALDPYDKVVVQVCRDSPEGVSTEGLTDFDPKRGETGRYPTLIELHVGYLQSTKTYKQIVRVEICFRKFISIEGNVAPPEYDFRFHLYPMSGMLILDDFGFPLILPVIFTLIIAIGISIAIVLCIYSALLVLLC